MPAVAPAARLVALARAARSPAAPGRRLPRRHGIRAAGPRAVGARHDGPRPGAVSPARASCRPGTGGPSGVCWAGALRRAHRVIAVSETTRGRDPGALPPAARAGRGRARGRRPALRAPPGRRRSRRVRAALRARPPVRAVRRLPRAEEEPRRPPRGGRPAAPRAARGARPSSWSWARPAGARTRRGAPRRSGSTARCASSAPAPDADLPALYGGRARLRVSVAVGGLRAAGPRGDGGRRARRRLEPRRPARGDGGGGAAGRARAGAAGGRARPGSSPTRRCASGCARPASPARPTFSWERTARETLAVYRAAAA